jgi:hypothetical protein
LTEALTTLAESMVGYRNILERQGWSPTAAEGVATHALLTLQTTALAGIGNTSENY